MQSYYCRLKDEKLQNLYIGHAVDSQVILQQSPDAPGGVVPTIMVGVCWLEIDEEGSLKPSDEPSPSYISPDQIQFLGLVEDTDIDDILDVYYGLESETEDEDEVQTPPPTQTAPPTRPLNA